MELRLQPIGRVRRLGAEKKGGRAQLEIDEAFRDGLFELEQFSHALVLWWADRRDTVADRRTLRVRPRTAPDHVTGVFATRSPARPNPIAVSVCRLLAVDRKAGAVELVWIDADDGTSVIDLKGYIPGADRVRTPRVPDWLSAQPQWAGEAPDDVG